MRLGTLTRNALKPDPPTGDDPQGVPPRDPAGVHRGEGPEATRWAAGHAADPTTGLAELDPQLWADATAWADGFAPTATLRLAASPYDLGGGGNYVLLHYLTLRHRPSNVVETGVAAGWSSEAILTGLDVNGHGHLWSSDLPYFRLPNPEALIGLVVSDHLKSRWTLHTSGDRASLPQIVQAAAPIDLLHYDSDKSYEGRDFAAATLAPALSPATIEVWDDIGDNWHFRDRVERLDRPWFVCAFGGKHVGVIQP